MDLTALQDKLVTEQMAEQAKSAARRPPQEDPLRGMTPEQAEKKAEEIMAAALDAEQKIAALKAELAPVLKIAKSLGTSRRFQQMVSAADTELVAIGALFVKLRETEGYWRKGTQDMLIEEVLKTHPELEDLLKDAKADAKTFNQGFAKVQVWDKKPEDKRKKAPYEVKLAADRVASLDKEAGIWDVLKKVYTSVRKLSEPALEWARKLFVHVYETQFERLVGSLRDLRRDLERAVERAT